MGTSARCGPRGGRSEALLRRLTAETAPGRLPAIVAMIMLGTLVLAAPMWRRRSRGLE